MSGPPPEAEPSPAQRWFRLAEEDLAAADVLVRDGSAALRIAGFLAQQGAEKALKAGLFAARVTAPKIHGLRQLHASYPNDDSPQIEHDDLDRLDPWVIDGRYAADLPELGASEAKGTPRSSTTCCRSRPPARSMSRPRRPRWRTTTGAPTDDRGNRVAFDAWPGNDCHVVDANGLTAV